MAKKPPNTAPKSDEEKLDYSRQHPLLRHVSQTETFSAKAAERKEANEFKIEELKEWKVAVNRLAASPDGQRFLRAMIAYSGLMAPSSARDTVKIVEEKWRLAFYLTHVRPYLDPSIRKELE